MDIIHCNLLKNIIGFDIGNGLTTPILRNNIIPCSNIIQFIMPEINIFHSIKQKTKIVLSRITRW